MYTYIYIGIVSYLFMKTHKKWNHLETKSMEKGFLISKHLEVLTDTRRIPSEFDDAWAAGMVLLSARESRVKLGICQRPPIQWAMSD